MTIVPIIVVFTKFDDFMSGLGEGVASSQELAEREFNEKYGCSFETSTNKGLVPYTVVASTSSSCVASTRLTSPRSLAT